MGLDTKVEGDPESLTAVCGWLKEQSSNTSGTAEQVRGTGGDSESGWQEKAGDAFRSLLNQSGKIIDNLIGSLDDTCGALQTHADDLQTVKAKMQRARDVAAEGGLEVRGYEIQEPGPAPASPQTLPKDKPATQEQKQGHAAATQAAAAFEKKAQAYAQASQIVEDAKKKESDSQNILIRFLSGTFDPTKLGLTLADMSSGALAATAVRTSKFKEFADAAMTKAERASKLAASTNLSFANRSQAIGIQVTNEVNAKAALDDATAGRIARTIDRFPPTVKEGIRAIDKKIIPKPVTSGNPILKGATKVGSKLPWVGLGITAAGVGYDVGTGKDPTQAVTSAGASFVSGAVVGAAVGGPVGVVVGGVVGIGVGFAVDELWPD